MAEALSFEHHSKYVCIKLNKSLYCINKALNFLATNALLTLYFSLNHSQLSYFTPIPTYLCYQPSFSINFQNKKKTIQIVTRQDYHAHTDPIFAELKILPFPKLLTYSQLKPMQSIVNTYCLPSLWHIFQLNEQCDFNHYLHNANLFTIPNPRIELLKISLLFCLPTE